MPRPLAAYPYEDIPTALRPREKLQTLGPAALADAELLALLLRTGMKGLSVLQLAEKVLTDLGDCPGFCRPTGVCSDESKAWARPKALES